MMLSRETRRNQPPKVLPRTRRAWTASSEELSCPANWSIPGWFGLGRIRAYSRVAISDRHSSAIDSSLLPPSASMMSNFPLPIWIMNNICAQENCFLGCFIHRIYASFFQDRQIKWARWFYIGRIPKKMMRIWRKWMLFRISLLLASWQPITQPVETWTDIRYLTAYP